MYVEAVGTLPPVGMSMLSVQIIPPSFGIAHLSFGLSASSWTTSPDHATDAAKVPFVSGWAKSLPVKRTTWPGVDGRLHALDRGVEAVVGHRCRIVAVREHHESDRVRELHEHRHLALELRILEELLDRLDRAR